MLSAGTHGVPIHQKEADHLWSLNWILRLIDARSRPDRGQMREADPYEYRASSPKAALRRNPF